MQTLHMPDISYYASRERKAPLEEDGMISTFVLLWAVSAALNTSLCLKVMAVWFKTLRNTGFYILNGKAVTTWKLMLTCAVLIIKFQLIQCCIHLLQDGPINICLTFKLFSKLSPTAQGALELCDVMASGVLGCFKKNIWESWKRQSEEHPGDFSLNSFCDDELTKSNSQHPQTFRQTNSAATKIIQALFSVALAKLLMFTNTDWNQKCFSLLINLPTMVLIHHWSWTWHNKHVLY